MEWDEGDIFFFQEAAIMVNNSYRAIKYELFLYFIWFYMDLGILGRQRNVALFRSFKKDMQRK